MTKRGVTLNNITYTYAGTDFNLDITEFSFLSGECTALCGHNGSGKTTLGKLAAGLLRPDAGTVRIEGEDIGPWPLGKIGASVGYLFQEPSRQLFAPVVREDMIFPLLLRGVGEDEASAKADALLERFELSHLSRQSAYTLSHGEKQRLAICAMLVAEPGYLVLDEPTTGLDSRRRGILKDMLRSLLDYGLGILLISHDNAFIRAVASRSCRMENGRLLDE